MTPISTPTPVERPAPTRYVPIDYDRHRREAARLRAQAQVTALEATASALFRAAGAMRAAAARLADLRPSSAPAAPAPRSSSAA